MQDRTWFEDQLKAQITEHFDVEYDEISPGLLIISHEVKYNIKCQLEFKFKIRKN